MLETTTVTQIDILEEYQLLLVLSNKTLQSYPVSALNPDEPATVRRPKKIQNHCSFFKTGICLGRHLVCCVKSSALSTTIKVFEPNDAMTKAKKQKGISKFMSGGHDELKPFKEFYIPTESSSVHFLKSKLCVACARGFEVVSLETLETQSLLDQADTSLDFVNRKEGVKPIHIERLNGEFLLNYSEFSFFVNRNGWRARPEWRIDWEGTPQNFALSYPWILAFEPNFIELRNMENGAVHIVPRKNIRMLHSSTHEVSRKPLMLPTMLIMYRFYSHTRTKRETTWSRPLTFGRATASRSCSAHSNSHGLARTQMEYFLERFFVLFGGTRVLWREPLPGARCSAQGRVVTGDLAYRSLAGRCEDGAELRLGRCDVSSAVKQLPSFKERGRHRTTGHVERPDRGRGRVEVFRVWEWSGVK